MNAVDLLLTGLLLLALLGGVRAGFVARAFSWAGLVVGVVLATRSVPLALGLLEDASAAVRLFGGVFVLALTVAVATAIFAGIGARLREHLVGSQLSRWDRIAGGLAGMAAVLAIAWFVLPAAAEVPGVAAREVRTSSMFGVVRAITPTPPDATRTVRALLDRSRFPEVFEDLQPAPSSGPPPTQVGLDDATVDAATASTVNIEATACGRRFEGSGVTVDQGIVLTNAHVVAGADELVARRPDGSTREATVLVFDPDRDLAVLEVDDLEQAPLDLAAAQEGTEGVAIGYPGGRDTPRVAPLRIDQRRTAVGRDIYGAQTSQREVLFLSVELQQGDSGAPVVDDAGQLVGLVFAISPDVPTTAYALDLVELEAVLAAPRSPGETGGCIS